jgi:hypothetical protein
MSEREVDSEPCCCAENKLCYECPIHGRFNWIGGHSECCVRGKEDDDE